MAKRGLSLTVTPDKDNKDVLRMLRVNWKKRFENLKAQLVYHSAESALKTIKRKVPLTAETKSYLASLELARITGLPQGAVGYAIQGKAKKTGKKALTPDGTILYVRARKRPRRLPPEVATLVKYSPWTLNNLPFTPKKADATVIYRKVSARTVEKVEKSRKKDRRFWKQELSKKRISDKGQKSKFNVGTGRVRAVSDQAFNALNLEFGQGGVKARPHWRIAISDLKRKELRNMMKNGEMTKAVSDPMSKTWVAWPKKTAKRISAKVAETFVPFQQKLGIKTPQ